MKKIVSFSLILIIVLMLEIVFADASAPNIKNYIVEVTNPNGAYTYTGKIINEKFEMIMSGKVNFGEKLEASYEENINGENYVTVYKIGESGEQNSYIGLILLRDIKGVQEGLSLSDYGISEEPIELTVIKNDGVKIYEWPASSYDVVGSVPYKKVLQGYGCLAMQGWYYITYNGVNGFISEFDGALGTKSNVDDSFMTLWKNVPITNSEGNEIGELPKNTIFKDFYYTDYLSRRIFITYNGISGYVDKENVAYDIQDDWMRDAKNYKVGYDGAVLIGIDNSITEIPKGKTVECTYMENINSPNLWGYTTYEGKQGWVYCIALFDDGLDPEYNQEITNEGLNYLKNVIEEVKKYPVESSGELVAVVSGEVLSGDIGEDESGNSTLSVTDTNSLTSSQIILICILCAVAASVTTAVIIILINKKKRE